MREFHFTKAKIVTTNGQPVANGIVQPHESLALLAQELPGLVPGQEFIADLDSNRVALKVLVSYVGEENGVAIFQYPNFLQVEGVDAEKRQASGIVGPIMLEPERGPSVKFSDPVQGSLAVIIPQKLDLEEKIVIGCKVTSGKIQIYGKVIHVGNSPETSGWRHGLKIIGLTDDAGAEIPINKAAEALLPQSAA